MGNFQESIHPQLLIQTSDYSFSPLFHAVFTFPPSYLSFLKPSVVSSASPLLIFTSHAPWSLCPSLLFWRLYLHYHFQASLQTLQSEGNTPFIKFLLILRKIINFWETFSDFVTFCLWLEIIFLSLTALSESFLKSSFSLLSSFSSWGIWKRDFSLAGGALLWFDLCVSFLSVRWWKIALGNLPSLSRLISSSTRF